MLEREISDQMALFAPLDAPESRTTPEQYDDLLRSGDTEGVPIELVDGLLIYKMPQNRTHSRTIGRILRTLIKATEEPLEVLSAGTVAFGTRRFEPDDFFSVHNIRKALCFWIRASCFLPSKSRS